MIFVTPTANGTTNGTTITIQNWDIYQGSKTKDVTKNDIAPIVEIQDFSQDCNTENVTEDVTITVHDMNRRCIENVTKDITKVDTALNVEIQGFSQDCETKNVTKDVTKTVQRVLQRPCTNKNIKNEKNEEIYCASDDAQGVISENKEPIPNKPRKKQKAQTEEDEDFEKLWEMYPRKKGKANVKQAQRKKLHDIGIEEMTRAIKRYCQYVAGKDEQFIQYGSTFFNSGYVDYLDSNYKPMSDARTQASAKPLKPAGIRFDP